MTAQGNGNGNGDNGRRRGWRRLIMLSVGWVLVLLGIAGLFLPILQGILFLVAGLYVLSLQSARVRLLRQRGRQWLARRFPETYGKLHRAEAAARDWVHRRVTKLRPVADRRPDHWSDR